MKKYTVMQKTCGWPFVYDRISQSFGKTAAEALLAEASAIFGEYSARYRAVKGIRRMHVMAAAAAGSMYLPLKKLVGSDRAVRMMTEAEEPLSRAKHNKIERLPAGMFMKTVSVITSVMFGEKAGFQRRQHSNTAEEKRFDLLSCPYVEVLREMGCPEVCPAICIQDDYSFSDMKNGVIFERRKTLGRGDDCCDFCYRLPERKVDRKEQTT